MTDNQEQQKPDFSKMSKEEFAQHEREFLAKLRKDTRDASIARRAEEMAKLPVLQDGEKLSDSEVERRAQALIKALRKK